MTQELRRHFRPTRRARIASLCLLAAIPTFMTQAAQARPVDYVINQETATIAFSTYVANVVPVDGVFRSFNAHIQFDTDRPSAVRIDVIVDDRQIDVPFGGADTLRSTPYFDAVHFPTIRFHSDAVQSLPGDRFVIAGILTVRGVSRPQILTGVLTPGNVNGAQVMHLIFHSSLNRAAFGLTADRPLIADEVSLTIRTTLRAP